MQKYSNVKLNKQFIINTSNFDKGFLQSDCLITETNLFRIYTNVDFPSLNINMGISRLRLVSETIKISELE